MADITYCTCVECTIKCDKHVSKIPKHQTHASFAPLYRTCKPYIELLLEEALEESKNGTKSN